MEYNSPLSKEKERTLISLLNLQPKNKVIEVGCGNGKLLLNLVEASDVNILGIDINAELVSAATEAAKAEVCETQYQFICKRFDELTLKSHYYDTFICNGSSHAFGIGEGALNKMAQQAHDLLNCGGRFLLGECYWKKQPPQAFLEFLGQPSSIYRHYKGNMEVIERHGFKPLYATSSNQEEWDDFEWRRKLNINNKLKLEPDNKALLDEQARIQHWLDAYVKWGRDHLGYGFYLFEKVDL
ncbi:hypothetical protein A7985_06145 [Pseudoalteromonas luteoviolacea]|uniref:Methyltransferase domain-containing protein n=1 Tax=Pseudoalteromonas luteoviolacea TaxID=43657 RepID=A0A1C0TW17_9GAMM|nr:class I SAM-dependent methyltransferase [Pseudoalteromonas luteoviolacea]OCQ23518.1 hypothetical protein A7985_06145 [Pseudoalteromonas luteoviolacea]